MVWKIQRCFPGSPVECADVAGRSRQGFGHAARQDEHVLEHDAGRAGAHAQALGRLAETLAQIDAAVGAEGRNRPAGGLVEGDEPVAVSDEHAVGVHGDAAMPEARARRRPAARIVGPELLAGVGGKGHDLHRRRGGVEHAVDDHRVALHLRGGEVVAALVGPGDLQLGDVLAGDLSKRGVARVARSAVHRPVGVRRLEPEDDGAGDQAGAREGKGNQAGHAADLSPGTARP